MRRSQAIKNISHITLSTIGALLGVWFAYHFTYSFPLAIVPAIILTVYSCFVLSLNFCAMAFTLSISYSQYRKATFLVTKRKTNALVLLLLMVLLGGYLAIYKSAIKRFDDKELKLYGKTSIAIVYKYHYSHGKGPKKRHIKYYYDVGNRNYEGDCINNIQQIGDTLTVIYSTHIPQIHKLVYPPITF